MINDETPKPIAREPTGVAVATPPRNSPQRIRGRFPVSSFIIRVSSLAALAALPACRTPAPQVTLAPVNYANQAQAAALLNARRAAVRTVQAQAQLTLRPVQGESQTLDAQLVLNAPDHARLRASKLNHNVFDLTVTPQGVWTAVSSRVTDEAPDAQAGLVRLAKVLPFLFRGPDYATATAAPRQQPRQLNLAWHDGLTVDLDAATLTPLRFTLGTAQSAADQPIIIEPVYSLYPASQGDLDLVWLHSAVATGPFGRVTFSFHHVTLNAPLNPRAFKPLRRATAHPR